MSFTNAKFIIVDIYEQNWLDDLRISCKSPYKLVKFIKIDGDLKEELKEFEGDFEKDEVVELQK
jgi:hypothetical protein